MKLLIVAVRAASVMTAASFAVAGTARPISENPSGVIDCRAGCQGQVTGCRESTIQRVTIVADPGFHLVPGSLYVQKKWNASDSPGLAAEPKWVVVDQFPKAGPTLSWVTIAPDLSTCTGISGDTQGVTFYKLQMLEER